MEDASVRLCQMDELLVITALRGDEHADKYAELETQLLPFVRMAKQTLRCAKNGGGTSYRCSIGPPFASREFLSIAA